jgi:hypothetical protein
MTSPLAEAVSTQTHPLQAPRSETFTRIERKFFIDVRRLGLVRAWLAHTCRPAPDYPAGQISSCYYDTLDMDEYFASFDGDLDKNKVRLRWYDSLPDSGEVTAFVELKSKHGAETTKRRAPLTVPASALAEEDFTAALPRETLSRYLLGFGYRAPLDLRPAAVITYHRYRFVERHSGMTLSLDSDIRAWLARDMRHWPPISLKGAVLELKGRDLELPAQLRALGRFGPVWTSFTKYGAAIEALSEAPGPFRL